MKVNGKNLTTIWYDEKKDFGLKLTNRTGTVSIGDQEEVGKYKNCFYPFLMKVKTSDHLIEWKYSSYYRDIIYQSVLHINYMYSNNDSVLIENKIKEVSR